MRSDPVQQALRLPALSLIMSAVSLLAYRSGTGHTDPIPVARLFSVDSGGVGLPLSLP